MPASKRRKPNAKPRRYSRTQPPSDLSTREWQVALRRQFGREQAFTLKNLGNEPVFSEFQVSNPESRTTYRVAIRGADLGDNYCACPDFATNLLGTCKHIEFVLGRLERRRGGAAALKRGFEPDYSEVWLRYGARRQICFRPGKRCTPALLRRARALFDATGGWCLSAARLAGLDDFLLAVRRSRHEVRCYDDAMDFAAELRADDERRRRLAKRFPQGDSTPALRELLKVPLYPYQCEGALFAARAGRAIIADEMGLGKTVQAVAAAEILLRDLDAERVLVVCPASLKHQWHDEIARLSGREVLTIGGPRRERARQFAQPAVFKIINYDTLHRDLELIGTWAPDLVIADEAQRIKNWDTRAARAMKRLKSRYALVLTGTPLENRLRELVSIVQFVDQYRLGPTW
ncbi:MAG: SNF2-related protein, partial [Gammaproteobacteria bacterium]